MPSVIFHLQKKARLVRYILKCFDWNGHGQSQQLQTLEDIFKVSPTLLSFSCVREVPSQLKTVIQNQLSLGRVSLPVSVSVAFLLWLQASSSQCWYQQTEQEEFPGGTRFRQCNRLSICKQILLHTWLNNQIRNPKTNLIMRRDGLSNLLC